MRPEFVESIHKALCELENVFYRMHEEIVDLTERLEVLEEDR